LAKNKNLQSVVRPVLTYIAETRPGFSKTKKTMEITETENIEKN
jgi:hypothetical protein